MRTRPDDQKSAAPLGAIYLLNEPNPNVGSQAITRLVGVDALEALISNTYRGAYIPLLGETERHLFQCIELARQVPVFKLDRVWGFDAFEEQARLVEQHARALP